MPIISRVGRRHPKVVITVALFYVLLVGGGSAMIYPFLLMISTSLTSGADEEEFRLLPRYLYDDRSLAAKYLLAKHETAGSASDRLYLDFPSLKVDRVIETLEATPPALRYDPKFPARADDYRRFLQGLPGYLKAGGWDHFSVMNVLHGDYRRWLAANVGGLKVVAGKYHEEIAEWRHVYVIRERPDARDWVPAWDGRYRDYRRFKEQACREEPWLFWAVAGDSKYAKFLRSELAARPELWAVQLVATDPVNAEIAPRLPVQTLLDQFGKLDPGAWAPTGEPGAAVPASRPADLLRARLIELGIQVRSAERTAHGAPGRPAALADIRLPTRQPLRLRRDDSARLAQRQDLLDRIVRVQARFDPKLAGEKVKVLTEDALWEKFVRTLWPVQLIGFDAARREEVNRRFARFLRDRLDVKGEAPPGDRAAPASADSSGLRPPKWASADSSGPAGDAKLALLVSLYNRDGHVPPIDWTSWDEVAVPTWEHLFGRLRAHYERFILLDPGRAGHAECAVPAGWLVLDTVEQRWRAWVRKTYGHTGGDAIALTNLNLAHGTDWRSIERLRPPVLAFEQGEVVSRSAHWRRQFVLSNYREVLDLILFHGNALANTFALIVGTILLALTVNPLAAYALSRFNLRYSNRVLLFLLATMAFPAEVAMIPGFLLIRDLGMLNTFAALLLPTAANGYSIFLLKGFFDTLPIELYEAAQLDGAGELRMFYQITVPLCKPVFAFMALGAFTAAYGAFLFAMLTCQDPRMWTMMVWLYDLSNKVTGGLGVAAFTVAAVPTLLVFIFCQRIIMRGIILPQIH